MALELEIGDLNGLWALHKCDVPLCCNPSHLYAGTRLDNARDAVERGRLRPTPKAGELNARAVLTDVTAREAIKLIAGGATNIEIGERFGVHHATISALRRGITWKYIERPDFRVFTRSA